MKSPLIDADPPKALDDMVLDSSAPGVDQRFVIRLYIDCIAPETCSPRWHGYIDDAMTRKPYPFRNLTNMTDFLITRLERLGITPGWGFRLRRRFGFVRAISDEPGDSR